MQRDLQALATVVNQLSTTRLLADASAKAYTIINRAKEQAEMWDSMSMSTITYVHCVLSYIHEDNETGSVNFDCTASFLVTYYLHTWSTFNVSNVDKNAVIKILVGRGFRVVDFNDRIDLHMNIQWGGETSTDQWKQIWEGRGWVLHLPAAGTIVQFD
jgi:hypothetical protein